MNEEYKYSDNSYRLCFNSITVEKIVILLAL